MTDRKRRRPALFLGTALVVLATGACSTNSVVKLYPVRGQVFFEGKPAAGAQVVFHPAAESTLEAPKPAGVVQEDGSYSLSTHPFGDGAPSGEYRVAVIWIDPNAADRSNLTNRLPAKYVRPATSGLMATVTAGPTDVPPFQLKK